MLLGLLFLFLLPGSVLCKENCSYLDIIQHLNLTSNKDLFTLSRPVKDIRSPLEVYVEYRLEAILDVRESDQTFISSGSIDIAWENEFIFWDEDEFCEVKRITVPSELLWKPDLRIVEMVEKDKTPASPFLVVKSDGTVIMKNDQVILSTCKMNVFKFPFDTQKCNLSIRSFIHTIKEINLTALGSGEMVKERIQENMVTQYEWLFEDVEINTCASSDPQDMKQRILVFSLSMRRRSILYVVNFILPVLFFLGLDFASFLMSDTGGDKLGFKVTILLAVTVLQLLLNEILPSSSDHIPLIAIFCIGVFVLMKLSLLETVVVMFLLDQDAKYQKSEKKEGAENVLVNDSSADLILEQKMEKEAKGKGRTPADSGSDVDRLLRELRHACTVLSRFVEGSREEEESGYWASRIASIHKVFLLVYSCLSAVFLGTIFSIWLN